MIRHHEGAVIMVQDLLNDSAGGQERGLPSGREHRIRPADRDLPDETPARGDVTVRVASTDRSRREGLTVTEHSLRQNCRDALLDRAEVPAQISATDPAFGGSYRSDDLCATAACEPRPYQSGQKGYPLPYSDHNGERLGRGFASPREHKMLWVL